MITIKNVDNYSIIKIWPSSNHEKGQSQRDAINFHGFVPSFGYFFRKK